MFEASFGLGKIASPLNHGEFGVFCGQYFARRLLNSMNWANVHEFAKILRSNLGLMPQSDLEKFQVL